MKIKKIDLLLAMVVLVVVLPIMAVMVPTGDVRFMVVSGTSMEPTITEKDIIVVEPVEPDSIQAGDIISFRYRQEEGNEVIITHRVMGRVEGGFRTRGDAYDHSDPYVVSEKDVVGIMSMKIPLVGFFVHFARTAQGLAGMVVLPALLIVIDEIKKIVKGETR